MNNYISVSCANMFNQGDFRSEIVSQAVLWEKIKIEDANSTFVKVESEDGCQGWVSKYQISESEFTRAGDQIRITASEINLYSEAGILSPVIQDIVAGITLPLIEKHNHWIKVAIPNGNYGWIEDSAIKALPALSRENLIKYAAQFMGRPYFWGGKTPKGFDCSGFIQFVHKMYDIDVRRNSWMQFEDGHFVSDDPFKGQLGDLMFFAESGDTITHVGFCLGDGKILHAQGMVRYNSLHKGDALFSETLINDFVGIRSFL